MTDTPNPAPGWYADPSIPGMLRWWDGAAWTANTAAAPPPAPHQPAQADPAMHWVLPVGRSGFAIAAGYAALVSVCVLPAPFALVFGILGLRDIKQHPDKTGKGRAVFGIVMGALVLLVVLAALLYSLVDEPA